MQKTRHSHNDHLAHSLFGLCPQKMQNSAYLIIATALTTAFGWAGWSSILGSISQKSVLPQLHHIRGMESSHSFLALV